MAKTITAKEARGVAEHTITSWREEQINEYDEIIREACADAKFETKIWENKLVDGTVEHFKELGYTIEFIETDDPRDSYDEKQIIIRW
jgi:hypothetical protein